MKKVLLLGDSIRIGYEKYVRMAFDGTAQIYAPTDNCRFTQYLLRYIIEWQEVIDCGSDIDVVHWNAGLWDILRLADGELQTLPEHYTYYLERICNYLKMIYPNAVQIFATSTKVVEYKHTGKYKRANGDIQAYNEAAVRTLIPHGVIINDLYALSDTFPEEYWSDITHFNTKEGASALTAQVCRCIGNALDLQPVLPDFDKLFTKETNIISM